MNKTLLVSALALAVAGPAIAGRSATDVSLGGPNSAVITPVNINAPNVGLNDPTPATPMGGNPGQTIGEQRRIAYRFAADLWGAVLTSSVEIKVEAQFTPLSCTASSGVLGSAGTKQIFGGFTNAVIETWYGGALANARSGVDQNPADNDIRSNFNSNLGTPGCLENSGWYYGLDGKTPAGRINFLDVVMHEIGHGLNFQGFYNTGTGAPPSNTQPTWGDIYSNNVYDNVSAKTWKSMTNAERVTAAVAGGLVWTGASVTAQVPAALSPLQRLFFTGALNATYVYGTAAFGPLATPANFNGNVVLVNDGTGADPADGCETIPAGTLTGKVAFINRGACAFEIKTVNAQNAGATEVIIGNVPSSANPGTAPGMGEDPTVVATIPAVSLNLADADAVRAAITGGINAAIQNIPGQYAGADTSGRAKLYAPNPLEPGSSFSHYDTSHFPNALMEPAINQDLDANARLDLTPALYQDEGWTLSSGNASFGQCTSLSIPLQAPVGKTPGATLVAAHKTCAVQAGGARIVYRKCMADVAINLAATGVLTNTQANEVRACATKP